MASKFPTIYAITFRILVGARAGIRTRVTGVTVLYDRPDYTTRANNNARGRQRRGVPTKGSTTHIARRLYCWDRNETRCGPPALTAVPERVLTQPFLNFSVIIGIAQDYSKNQGVKSEMPTISSLYIFLCAIYFSWKKGRKRKK